MGVPPFVGVAVKVTLSPAQIVSFPEIVTLAGSDELTDMVMELEVAGEPVAQDKEEVIIQVMTSPSFRVVVE